MLFKGLKFFSKYDAQWVKVIDVNMLACRYTIQICDFEKLRSREEILECFYRSVNEGNYLLPTNENKLPIKLQINDWKTGDKGVVFSVLSNKLESFTIKNEINNGIELNNGALMRVKGNNCFSGTAMRIEKNSCYTKKELYEAHRRPGVTHCVQCNLPLKFVSPYCPNCEE